MVRFAPVAALSLIALPAMMQPAHAQGRVVRRDLGFSFVVPDGYDFAPEDRVPKPYAFKLNGPLSAPTTLIGTEDLVLNRYLIAGIMAAAITPDPTKNEDLGLPSDADVEKMMSGVGASRPDRLAVNFQGSADIRIDGERARAFSLTLTEPTTRNGVRMRMIFTAHSGRAYIFTFSCVDGEFPGKVVAFEKTMASLRWIDRTGLPPLPEAKPAPKKPTGKKKL